MAQWLKALTVLSENLCLILCIHMFSHSQLLPLVPGVLMACSGSCGSQACVRRTCVRCTCVRRTCVRCTDTHTGKTSYTQKESTAQWSTHSEDVLSVVGPGCL